MAQSRRWLIPEVIQTSAMDCGPASLKALLDGFGASISYGRLREACQTDVDGTSIDALEALTTLLGYDAEQVMIPADHVLLASAQSLPAIVVVRLPDGNLHFVVVWRRIGPWLQVMDPAIGRRWLPIRDFLLQVYQHQLLVEATAWRDWAGSQEFLDPLRERMQQLGLTPDEQRLMIEQAVADPEWYGLAALDASLRLLQRLHRDHLLPRRVSPLPQLQSLVADFTIAAQHGHDLPWEPLWSVKPSADSDDPAMLWLRGAVLLRVRGLHHTATVPQRPLELEAALHERSITLGDILQQVFAPHTRRWFGVMVLIAAVLGALRVVEGLLLRDLLSGMLTQALAQLPWLLLFFGSTLLLQIAVSAHSLRLGRQLELRFRTNLFQKLLRLGDRYFQSRLISDMAERSHLAHRLAELPTTISMLAQLGAAGLSTVAALVWVYPAQIWPVIGMTGATLIIPLIGQYWMSEQDLKLQGLRAALSRFYLDGLLGLATLQAHRGQAALQYEHEQVLGAWRQNQRQLFRTIAWFDGLHGLVVIAGVGWMVFQHMASGGGLADTLLLTYWGLSLFMLGYEVAALFRLYHHQRHHALRLTEPLRAPDDPMAPEPIDQLEPLLQPVAVHMNDLCLQLAGRDILQQINLQIAPGEHLALVGSSGAGKSSLVGLLLGWYRPSQGTLLVDHQPFLGPQVTRVRRQTVWVDPAVQLWNRSLEQNVRYGHTEHNFDLPQILSQAELMTLVTQLPDGVDTLLGESGALVSGGEGQRVRFGRALTHATPQLVILDEPFRGLTRDQRRQLLARARAYWQSTTLICITHDLAETRHFERVVVIEQGTIVEDGHPQQLEADPESRYATLLAAEAAVQQQFRDDPTWRRVTLATHEQVE